MNEDVFDIFKISVVIPIYNAESTIVETIYSVINQTFAPLEIILVDDGSSDSSIETVNQLFSKEISDGFIYIYYQENGGASKARNLGVNKSNGNWIAFLDSDDIWEQSKLKEQVFCLRQNKDCKIIATASNISNIGSSTPFIFIKYEHLLFKNYFATSSVMLYREVFMNIGGFKEDLRFSEDYNLWLNILYFQKNGIILTKKLLKYNLDGVEKLSKKRMLMLKGEFSNYVEQFNKNRITLLMLVILCVIALGKLIKRIIF
jgi:teichuronic acid biosynthesis glycosyltransferase TuaG